MRYWRHVSYFEKYLLLISSSDPTECHFFNLAAMCASHLALLTVIAQLTPVFPKRFTLALTVIIMSGWLYSLINFYTVYLHSSHQTPGCPVSPLHCSQEFLSYCASFLASFLTLHPAARVICLLRAPVIQAAALLLPNPTLLSVVPLYPFPGIVYQSLTAVVSVLGFDVSAHSVESTEMTAQKQRWATVNWWVRQWELGTCSGFRNCTFMPL